MPSIRQSIRSSTASKRPTSAIADGQIALNTASGTPGLFFKDSANNIIKAGPAHYGASAPNSSPAVGGSTGNSIGEAWLDSSLTPAGWKIWSGSAWVNATPLSSDTVQGLVELATDAETQAGVDTARAVTSAGLQSKVSDSISTASSSGIASSSAVKTAYDLANAALPKSGGIVTGNLEIGTTGSLTFEGSSADGFETTLAVVNPTADRTITLPNVTGTVVTTGDSGTVTSTMIADNTIVNAEISTTAAIAFSKLASLTSANIIVGNASGVPTATAVTGDVTITNSGVTAIASNVIVNADINSAAAIAYSKLALSSGITNTDVSASAAIVYSKLALSSGITNTDVNASAAIAGTKISPNFGSQNLTTTGNITAANHIAASGTAAAPSIAFSGDTNTGIYSPGADQLAITTGGTVKAIVDSNGRLLVGTSTSNGAYGFELQGNGGNNDTGRMLLWRNNAPFGFISGTEGAGIEFGASPSSGVFGVGGRIQFEGDGSWSSGSYAGRLVFSTTADGVASPTERMRITNGGYIKTSNTGTYTDAGGASRATNLQHFFRSDQNGLTIQATNTNTGSGVEGFTSDFVTGATGYHFIGATNLVRVFIVAANGNVTNTNNSYGAISDIKLKENIVDANSQWNDVKAFRVRNYNFKNGQTHRQIGLVAQEAELVSPGIISESPDLDAEGNDLGTVTKSVNYSVLYMKAVKALQEAMERIETLETRLSALEGA